MVDLRNDPAYNDDSQPSVTTSTEALRLADEMAGVPARVGTVVRAPADAMDMEHRVAVAETETSEELGRLGAVSAPEPIAEATGSVTPVEGEDEDTGTGTYEDRSLAQLQATARAKGVSPSGSKAEIIDRLRA